MSKPLGYAIWRLTEGYGDYKKGTMFQETVLTRWSKVYGTVYELQLHPCDVTWRVSLPSRLLERVVEGDRPSAVTSMLQQAQEIVNNRRANYGDPFEDMDRIAGLWSAYLGITIKAHQVPACMILVKLSRLANDPKHKDSIVDVVGYADVYNETVKHA